MMHPIRIDFLAEQSPGARRKILRRQALWVIATLLAAVDIGLFAYWQEEHSRLSEQLARPTASLAADSPDTPPAVLAAAAIASAYDPALFEAVEQSIAALRRQHPDGALILKSITFDARQRKFVLQGSSADSRQIAPLRDEIQRRRPPATVSFPAVRSGQPDARIEHFDLAIRVSGGRE